MLDEDGWGKCYKSTKKCGKICESNNHWIVAHYKDSHYHLGRNQTGFFNDFIEEHFRTIDKKKD